MNTPAPQRFVIEMVVSADSVIAFVTQPDGTTQAFQAHINEEPYASDRTPVSAMWAEMRQQAEDACDIGAFDAVYS